MMNANHDSTDGRCHLVYYEQLQRESEDTQKCWKKDSCVIASSCHQNEWWYEEDTVGCGTLRADPVHTLYPKPVAGGCTQSQLEERPRSRRERIAAAMYGAGRCGGFAFLYFEFKLLYFVKINDIEIVLSCFLTFKIKETEDYVTSPRA